MTKRHDRTAIGGVKSVFQTTLWSEIRNAETNDMTRRRIIIDNLLKMYWKPVYCYLRHKGYDNESAKDLTQGFFHEIVLGHNLIQQADQTRGRFRTFLLTVLNRYITDVYRRDTAKKRQSADAVVPLDPANLPYLPAKQLEAGPEEVFYYAWASNLLDEVLAEVKDEYYSTGKSAYWEVFNAKVLAPILESTKPPSLSNICAKYGIERQSKASNMIVTVKRRFRVILKRHIRQFVQSDLEVEEEFRDLLTILSQG
jgi:RNA polymerase sigma-70 factor (ECF subfamily)